MEPTPRQRENLDKVIAKLKANPSKPGKTLAIHVNAERHARVKKLAKSVNTTIDVLVNTILDDYFEV